MRRTLIISGLGLLAVALFAAGYFFVFQKTDSNTAGAPKDFFSAFFPFGQGNRTSEKPTNETPGGSAQKVTARIRQVSTRPTAGAWFTSPSGTTTSPHIRFTERATGHIFETPTDSYAETRISNTTIPLIQELIVINDTTLLLRTLSDTETISNAFGVLNATNSEQSLDTSALKGFQRVAVAKNGLSMMTVTEVAQGSQIELAEPDGTKSRTILLSPIRSWIPLAGDSRFFIQSAPSSGASGFLYEIRSNGGLTKILSDIPGLLGVPSPTGRYILYSGSTGVKVFLGMIDTKTGQSYTLPLKTLATKCAWISEDTPRVFCAISDPMRGGTATLPDDWLLGKISFSDSVWIIRPIENTAHSLGYLQEIANTPIDVLNPTISVDGNFALFINKNDLSVWSLDLNRDQ
ncbi:MAG: hypothetical protein Greene07147_432 [Parcubacteria group bacterium Greene0714_7]|nr:MAG: hypothetical protein Greene07147_432 [Parcubacteria group bacterium Greene0714_7]